MRLTRRWGVEYALCSQHGFGREGIYGEWQALYSVWGVRLYGVIWLGEFYSDETVIHNHPYLSICLALARLRGRYVGCGWSGLGESRRGNGLGARKGTTVLLANAH